jgi:2-oxoglutarate ferredoxin oxidoreductase subunit beta
VAFVEVYQDCNVFNSGAFEFASKKELKSENCIYLEHGKPLIFGANRDKGVRLTGDGLPQVVSLNEVKEDDLIFHDEKADDPSLAFLLGRMRWPHLPEPMGVFRAVERPSYEAALVEQVEEVTAKYGPGDVQKLFNSGDTWEVK